MARLFSVMFFLILCKPGNNLETGALDRWQASHMPRKVSVNELGVNFKSFGL